MFPPGLHVDRPRACCSAVRMLMAASHGDGRVMVMGSAA
jgi:hypothetical protein